VSKPLIHILVLAIAAVLTVSMGAVADIVSPFQITQKSQTSAGMKLQINLKFQDLKIDEISAMSEKYHRIELAGSFLQHDEGLPNLPTFGRFIAIPEGSQVSVRIKKQKSVVYKGINVEPSKAIPLDCGPDPEESTVKSAVYKSSRSYPDKVYQVSESRKIRGVNVALISVTPFSYKPQSKELTYYQEMSIELRISQSQQPLSENRLRNRWWDSILKDVLLNYSELPRVDYHNRQGSGYDYIIITPDRPVFVDYAHRIRHWRTLQGIKTQVVTTTEVGGNTISAIEKYIDNAYNTWDIPPAVVLLLGDHSTGDDGIAAGKYRGYLASDNIYADVDKDHLPDIIFGRITVDTDEELERVVNKILDFERQPPQVHSYYNEPITAVGWQHTRWFQICGETVFGFWKNVLRKKPTRITALHSGSRSSWSSAPNTKQMEEYFGSSGLGYLPDTPEHITEWHDNATAINQALNAGSFMLLHRDHGWRKGWGRTTIQYPGSRKYSGALSFARFVDQLPDGDV
jgi:hypothetical protein